MCGQPAQLLLSQLVLPGSCDTLLSMQEGEVLFIPAKWWHQVQALSNSLSFSYWWS